MNKNSQLYMILAILCVALSSKAVVANTITIAADYWCPINCEPNSEKPGVMVEIAQNIFAQHGYNINYVTMPWSRALKAVRQGELHGAIGAYKEDAPDFIFPENEQAVLAFNFYVQREITWQYTGIKSLANMRLGVIKDYSYLADIDQYIKNNMLDKNRIFIAYGNGALESNIKQLIAGNLDTIIATDLVMQHALSKLGLQNQLKFAGSGSQLEKAYIAFSPNHPTSNEYAKILSEGMNKIRISGKLKTILHRYGLTDWK